MPPLDTFETKYPWLIAVILYGSTLYFFSNSLLLLLIPVLFVLGKDIKKLHEKRSMLLVVIFVVGGVLNASYRVTSSVDWGGGLRAIITLPLLLMTMYLSSVLCDFRVRRALYVLILLECIIGGVQFFVHSPNPFPGQLNEDLVDSSALSGFDELYFDRAYGLSSNSSVFSQKIFILVLLLAAGDIRLFGRKAKVLMAGAILLGLVATFNRTVIFALLILGCLMLVRRFARSWGSAILVALFITGGLISALLAYPLDALSDALSLGVTAGGMGSRYIIWEEAIEFIHAHLLWGNHSAHIYFDYFGTELHAHNSFLQIIAMHGVVLASLLFLFVGANISKRNFPYVLAIIAYSLTQYGIFWAISALDIVFYYFLLVPDMEVNWGHEVVRSFSHKTPVPGMSHA